MKEIKEFCLLSKQLNDDAVHKKNSYEFVAIFSKKYGISYPFL